ncbi:hypothetical protein MANI_002889 [Metarhizium anisopliae]
MANQVKNYFLAPSWDYEPDAKPNVTIALWNIISSPKTVIPPLAAATAVPAPDDTARSTKTGFEWRQERDKEKKYGLWTKFLSALLGIDVNVGHKDGTSVHDLYTFKEMVTKESFPTAEYLEKMVNQGSVRKYLTNSNFEKPVYVVVGTKAVSGTTVKQVLKSQRSTNFNSSANLTKAGAPLSLGPEFSVSNTKGDTVSFEGSSDFVFAFRIRKIVVNSQFEIQDEKDENEGTALGDYNDEREVALTVKGLEGDDSTAADHYGSKDVVVEDGDEEVRVITFQ